MTFRNPATRAGFRETPAARPGPLLRDGPPAGAVRVPFSSVELPDIVVTPEWLLGRLGSELRPPDGLVIADVRWKPGASVRDAFVQGHLPGAVSIDVDVDLARPAFDGPGRHPLPSPEAFAHAMGSAGIGDEDLVVVYDDAGGSVAARLWWMLHVTGHRAALLDLPSLETWTAIGGAWDTGAGSPSPEPASFGARPWPRERIADADDVRASLIRGTGIVVDARAGERYRGEVEPIDPVAGHIPGAVSAAWIGNRDPQTERLLAPAALRSRYAELGVRDGASTIASCGSGVTACLAVLTMERAGLPGARLYEGSWSDWTHDPSRPFATGVEPGTMQTSR